MTSRTKNRKANKPRKISKSKNTNAWRNAPLSAAYMTMPVNWGRPPTDPFAPSMTRALEYTDRFTFTAGGSGLYGTEQIMRLNSLFDPDLTGTGHQPYGFDQLAALYFRYKVHKVKLSLEFADPSGDGIVIAVAVQNTDSSQAITGSSQSSVAERPNVFTHAISNTGDQDFIFESVVDIEKIDGLTKNQFEANIEEYSALCTASPTRTPYVRIAIAALDQSSTPTLVCRLRMSFFTTFYSRTTLAQS